MTLVLFFATMVVAGGEITRRVWAGQPDAGPCERASSTAVFALAVAVALSWALALPMMLTRGSLLLGTGLVFAVTAFACRTAARREILGLPSRLAELLARCRGRPVVGRVLARLVVGAGALALVGAAAFFLWRGATIFDPSHDGSAYHLPKAALLFQSHGYRTFDSPDVRLARWPCNYELLLADVMTLDGSDAHTAWASVVFWVFFLLAAAGLAERWWGRGRHVLVVVLLAAAMPIVLLHADAYKNDLLTHALFLTTIGFTARWAATGGRAARTTALVGFCLALGTKASTLFLAAAIAPLVAWGCLRLVRAGARARPAEVGRWCAFAALVFLALGGTVYARNAIETGRPIISGPTPSYGDWGNLFRFTYLAFARPFSSRPNSVWVPWRHAYWFWGRDDLYFSDWGLPSSLLLALLPFGIARYARRERAGSASASERLAATLVSLAAFALIVPLRVLPLGFFAGYIRYTVFFPVFLFLWTVVPGIAELDLRGELAKGLATGGVWVAVTVFGWYMVNEVQQDGGKSLDYVLSIARHPEDRRFPRLSEVRAADMVDRFYAGPEDTVAFDGGIDSWSYECYGAGLRRSVVYLRTVPGAPVAIPSAAKWIVIDRLWNITFGHPSFHDFGDWDAYLLRGSPTAEDLQLFEQLKRDPRFDLVYRWEDWNQAVFRRVAP